MSPRTKLLSRYISSTTTTIGNTNNKTQKVLQNRAIQCSFTSVFHISKTSTNAKGWKEAKDAENIFIKAVIWPMSFMALLGFVGGGWWSSVLFVKCDDYDGIEENKK